jgi:hypothetical protein
MNKTDLSNNQTKINPSALTMQITITNGTHEQDTRLDLKCEPSIDGVADLWLLKMPRLSNPDAFARPMGPNEWELRLDALNETQPHEVLHYTPDNCSEWLDGVNDEHHCSPTEVLILASNGTFTVTVIEL